MKDKIISSSPPLIQVFKLLWGGDVNRHGKWISRQAASCYIKTWLWVLQRLWLLGHGASCIDISYSSLSIAHRWQYRKSKLKSVPSHPGHFYTRKHLLNHYSISYIYTEKNYILDWGNALCFVPVLFLVRQMPKLQIQSRKINKCKE